MEGNNAALNKERKAFANLFLSSPDAMALQNEAAHPDTIVSQSPLERLQDKLHALEGFFAQQQQQLTRLRSVVTEVTNLNEGLYKHVGDLKHRVAQLEQHNTQHRFHIDRKEERLAPDTSTRSMAGSRNRSIVAPALNTSISGNDLLLAFPAGLPTPTAPARKASFITDTIYSTNTSGAPQTPTSVGTRKSQTFLNKRETHNLTNFIPPAGAQIPIVPLTDVEVIVFFFNALQRPIVALRLYARNWGPADITRVLNEYRDIKPDGYHRNTCSVKCTKAIKRGRKLWGPDWEQYWRSFFLGADDADATDAIRLKDSEINHPHDEDDYPVLELLTGLKKLPICDDREIGLFSRAVQWCALNQADIGLSLIHKVVIALEHGIDPADALAVGTSPVDDMLVDVEDTETRDDHDTQVSQSAETVSSSLSEVDGELLTAVGLKEEAVLNTIAASTSGNKAYIKAEHGD